MLKRAVAVEIISSTTLEEINDRIAELLKDNPDWKFTDMAITPLHDDIVLTTIIGRLDSLVANKDIMS